MRPRVPMALGATMEERVMIDWLCKDPLCMKVIPPQTGPGRRRLFCSHECAMRYHRRMWARRKRLKATLDRKVCVLCKAEYTGPSRVTCPRCQAIVEYHNLPKRADSELADD